MGYDGLSVLNNYVDGVPSEPFDSSPWQWWDTAPVQAYDDANGTNILATQLTLNPTMGEAEAMEWIEQMVDYNTPRMALPWVQRRKPPSQVGFATSTRF